MIIELNDTVFARNVRYLREHYALSRRALAKLIGISPFRLQAIENQTVLPILPFDSFLRICEVFHVDADTLSGTDIALTPNSINESP